MADLVSGSQNRHCTTMFSFSSLGTANPVAVSNTCHSCESSQAASCSIMIGGDSWQKYSGTDILIVYGLVIFCGFSFHVLNLLLLLSNSKLLKQRVLAKMLLVNQARWPTGGWPGRLTGIWWPSQARTVVGELDDNCCPGSTTLVGFRFMVDLATQDVSAVKSQMAQNFNCLPRMTGATSSTSGIQTLCYLLTLTSCTFRFFLILLSV